jgi:uncharacterized protein YcbK (DUF882 family)
MQTVIIRAYSLKKDGEKPLTANFRVREFACQDGSDTIFIAEKLPWACQYIRSRTKQAFKPNSAYRTETHNRAEGGEEFSRHLYGMAADIPILPGYTPKQMAQIFREFAPDFGGCGIYSWGIHIDVDPEKRDWVG